MDFLSFARHGCPLCGGMVHEDHSRSPHARGSITWTTEFRGLYSGPEGLVLTGVGRNTEAHSVYAAPTDRKLHWSSAGDDLVEFGVMPRPSHEGRHGFIFHDTCWDMLERAMYPTPVPLQRLFDICMSLPIPPHLNEPCWGHDYGGAWGVNNDNFFPWEEERFEVSWGGDRAPVTSYDPYNVAAPDRILDAEPEQPPAPQQAASSPATQGRDCFTALPKEICATIAMLLPTADVLNARLASRSFWSVFHSQQFWASRFKPGSDRSWFWEALSSKTPRDWRSLYRQTHDARLTGLAPCLDNRRRIWGLVLGIVDILNLSWNELPRDLASSWRPDSADTAVADWVRAEADVCPPVIGPNDRFIHGCRVSRTQEISVPGDLARFSVSTIAVGDGAFIAGLSLTTVSGDTIRLGYHSSTEQTVDLSHVWGFRLAIGSRGIQAIQCITGPENSESPWLTCADDVPRTERLVMGSQIVGLEASFDGFKLVGLAVRTASSPRPETVPDTNRLRNQAVWYPSVPSRSLNLNEEQFLPRDFYTVGYKPLFWCNFGGPGGKYLPHLTRLSATINNLHMRGMLHINFFYAKEVPTEHRSFGRLSRTTQCTDTDFTIDGPGGERIVCIEFSYYYPEPSSCNSDRAEEGWAAWYKIVTNRGRKCDIRPRSLPKVKRQKGSERRKVVPAPGFAITGFYGTESVEDGGMSAVGVITEEVEEE